MGAQSLSLGGAPVGSLSVMGGSDGFNVSWLIEMRGWTSGYWEDGDYEGFGQGFEAL